MPPLQTPSTTMLPRLLAGATQLTGPVSHDSLQFKGQDPRGDSPVAGQVSA